jgi:hypothetical protein
LEEKGFHLLVVSFFISCVFVFCEFLRVCQAGFLVSVRIAVSVSFFAGEAGGVGQELSLSEYTPPYL